MEYDFKGWATKNDIRCSDGRTIRQNAFIDNDGQTVPLVWNHQHNDPNNVLGHALLENRKEGVFAYGKFNDTESGIVAKKLVDAGDVVSLSIYANQLKQNRGDVLHGNIREVSLVLAGANPEAMIVNSLSHGEINEEEAIIWAGIESGEIELAHAEADEPKEEKEKEDMAEEKKEQSEKTVQDVIDSMNEEQKKVLYALVGQALESGKTGNDEEDSNEEENDDMKHNVFDSETNNKDVLTHADQEMIISDMKRYGSLSESFKTFADNYLQHDDEEDKTPPYGLIGMEDVLFPDAKSVTPTPDFIKRNDDWVSKVLNGAKHTPFSRVKSAYADITADDARARGYIKGKIKLEEVFPLFKRVTTPTTIYKKQKMDRDDLIDITDFDVVSWLKAEMRMMLNEEIARAVLVGDGRSPSSDDKINEQNIRPIYKDTESELYAFHVVVEHASAASDDTKAKAAIRAIVKARKDYKGTGSPTLFCTEDLLTDMLLLEDGIGHALYTMDTLKTKLRVNDIVTVPVMENIKRTSGGRDYNLAGIVVNMADYTIGADKGGNVQFFDDFDIDYNQQKYLIETRCSGALVHPKSAMIVEFVEEAPASY